LTFRATPAQIATVLANAPTRPFRDMPRPRPHPILGNFPDWLGPAQGKTVLQRLERYAHECGPLARVPLGPTSIVAVNDVELAADLLANEDANYKGWTYILTRTVLDNVLLLNGEAWSEGRRLYRSALQGVDAVAAAEHQAAELAARLRTEPPREVDVAKIAHRLASDTVGRFVAGTRIEGALDADRARIQYELAAVGMDLQCQPWAYFSPARWTSLRASVRRMQEHFRGVVRARRASPPSSGAGRPEDVLGGLLRLLDAGEHTDDEGAIADTLINVFFTAHDVLASSLGWTLWLLAGDQKVQDRLREEVRASGTQGPYLSRVVKEGLRLYPGYALFGRNPQREMELAGYSVPRSALLIVSPYVIHRLPRYWDRPLVFDPDRWIGKEGPPPAKPEGAYMPFGAGHRGCLASRIAFPVLRTLVARVIEAAELRAKPGHEPVLAYCGTGYSENGLCVTLAAQNP